MLLALINAHQCQDPHRPTPIQPDPIPCCVQLRTFNDLKWISGAAAVMSLGYSTIAIIVTLINGKQPGTEYNLAFDNSTPDKILQAMNAIGIIAFACAPHS